MSVSGNEIGDLLVDIGIITAEELASAMEEQSRSGDRLTLILDRLGLVTYHQLKDSLELQFGVNFISLSQNVPEREIADLVSMETKYKFKLIPVASSGTHFTVAMVNPDDLIALDTLRVELRSGHLKQLVCTADEFEFCMKQLYEVSTALPVEAPEAAELNQNTELTHTGELGHTVELSHTASTLSEEFTLPASVIAQADALEKKVSPRVPAKKHLQSLFGDDDDDDMDSPVAPVAATEQAQPLIIEVSAEASVIADVIAASLVEPIPEVVVAPMPEPASSAPAIPEPEITPVAEPVTAAEVAEVAPVAEPATAAEVAPVAEPVTAAEVAPPIVTETKPVADPLQVSTDIAAAAARDQVALAENAMQTAVANVTSHLIESSLGAMNANASRKLLEDVVESELGGSEEETDINRMKEAQNASVMLLAHEIIGKATQKRCSDIHLEPDASGVSLRYFLHGELLADCMLPLEIHGALVGSYKVIAGLNPQELVKPQDKKFTTRVEEDEVELRITTIPTDNGEMVAISMRFTDPNSAGAIAQAKLSNLSEN